MWIPCSEVLDKNKRGFDSKYYGANETRKDFYGEKEDINSVSYGETLYEKKFPKLKREKTTQKQISIVFNIKQKTK